MAGARRAPPSSPLARERVARILSEPETGENGTRYRADDPDGQRCTLIER